MAKNANEMFRIFSRFNALFVRPHIRGAIREYQTQLMQRVKDDIEVLHDKFKVKINIYKCINDDSFSYHGTRLIHSFIGLGKEWHPASVLLLQRSRSDEVPSYSCHDIILYTL